MGSRPPTVPHLVKKANMPAIGASTRRCPQEGVDYDTARLTRWILDHTRLVALAWLVVAAISLLTFPGGRRLSVLFSSNVTGGCAILRIVLQFEGDTDGHGDHHQHTNA